MNEDKPLYRSPDPYKQPTLSQTGQKDFVIPESIEAYSFYATPGASATDTAMSRPGAAAAIPVVMPYRGSVVAVVLSANANKTAGTAVFEIRKNGTKLSTLGVSAALSWDNSIQRKTVRFAKSTYGFAKDDYLDVVFTTNGTYAPTTTIAEITVYVTLDNTDVI